MQVYQLINSNVDAKTNDYPLRCFQITKLLGAGGEGTVFLSTAYNWGNNPKQVALKLQKNMKDHEKQFIQKLIQYQNIYENGNNQQYIPSNIIRIYDYFLWKANHCIIMEVGSESLYDYIAKNNNQSIDDKIKICFQISQPILYLHNQNLIHQEIKPENYLKVGDNFKLIDFGLVHGSVPFDSQIQQIGNLIFQAPEIIESQNNCTEKVDVWALACLFYEILSSKSLFNESSKKEIINQIKRHKTTPAFVNAKINQLQTPEEIKKLIISMLNYTDKERPSIDKICNEFQKYLNKNNIAQQVVNNQSTLTSPANQQPFQGNLTEAQIIKLIEDKYESKIQFLESINTQQSYKQLLEQLQQTLQQQSIQENVQKGFQNKLTDIDSSLKQLQEKLTKVENQNKILQQEKNTNVESLQLQLQQKQQQLEQQLLQTQNNMQIDFENKLKDINTSFDNFQEKITIIQQEKDERMESLKIQSQQMVQYYQSLFQQQQYQQQQLQDNLQKVLDNKLKNIDSSINQLKEQLTQIENYNINQYSEKDKIIESLSQSQSSQRTQQQLFEEYQNQLQQLTQSIQSKQISNDYSLNQLKEQFTQIENYKINQYSEKDKIIETLNKSYSQQISQQQQLEQNQQQLKEQLQIIQKEYENKLNAIESTLNQLYIKADIKDNSHKFQQQEKPTSISQQIQFQQSAQQLQSLQQQQQLNLSKQQQNQENLQDNIFNNNNSVIDAPNYPNFPNRKFKTIRILGEGAQGTVYLAKSINWGLNDQKQFALKRQQNTKDYEIQFVDYLIQFQNQYENQNNISQYNYQKSGLIRIYERFKWNNQDVLIMEQGEKDLQKFINEQQLLTFQQKRDILIQISQSIQFLHQQQLIHRDIKPENFIKIGNQFKLIDFGQIRSNEGTNLTIRPGTTQYSAPEIIENKQNYTFAVDIWSLGCVFYEILLYQQLFTDYLTGKMNQLKVNDQIKNLMTKMLNPNYQQRLQINQVLQELKNIECVQNIPQQNFPLQKQINDQLNQESTKQNNSIQFPIQKVVFHQFL
ncbi:unnamed protein product [Paramecium sonneborni]|uniref:Protein kinase domain-containing protein n=1 Tax=Paramecium sonneborni TaxID=65129 RepID=A0A8S1NSH2_9CILI|nr:unnamed protein product [Paramecium sonneborni]